MHWSSWPRRTTPVRGLREDVFFSETKRRARPESPTVAPATRRHGVSSSSGVSNSGRTAHNCPYETSFEDMRFLSAKEIGLFRLATDFDPTFISSPNQ